MTQAYRPYSPKQAFLLPPSPTEWLPEDHLARFVMDVVGQLDLSAIHARYQQLDPRGTQPYHPLMMASLLAYGYCVGVASSRKIEKKTHEDVAFRVIEEHQIIVAQAVTNQPPDVEHLVPMLVRNGPHCLPAGPQAASTPPTPFTRPRGPNLHPRGPERRPRETPT